MHAASSRHTTGQSSIRHLVAFVLFAYGLNDDARTTHHTLLGSLGRSRKVCAMHESDVPI
jgi:hypothetical protein